MARGQYGPGMVDQSEEGYDRGIGLKDVEQDTPRLIGEIRSLQETTDQLLKTVRRAETQLAHLNPEGDQDSIPGNPEARSIASETVTYVIGINDHVRSAIMRLNQLLNQIDA